MFIPKNLREVKKAHLQHLGFVCLIITGCIVAIQQLYGWPGPIAAMYMAPFYIYMILSTTEASKHNRAVLAKRKELERLISGKESTFLFDTYDLSDDEMRKRANEMHAIYHGERK